MAEMLPAREGLVTAKQTTGTLGKQWSHPRSDSGVTLSLDASGPGGGPLVLEARGWIWLHVHRIIEHTWRCRMFKSVGILCRYEMHR